jgi:hypothetical protein
MCLWTMTKVQEHIYHRKSILLWNNDEAMCLHPIYVIWLLVIMHVLQHCNWSVTRPQLIQNQMPSKRRHKHTGSIHVSVIVRSSRILMMLEINHSVIGVTWRVINEYGTHSVHISILHVISLFPVSVFSTDIILYEMESCIVLLRLRYFSAVKMWMNIDPCIPRVPIQWPRDPRYGPWALVHWIAGSNHAWGMDVFP